MADFAADLAWSEAAEDEPFVEALVRAAFPSMVSFGKSPGNTAAQRMGIDRWVNLRNGQTLRIDFKLRRQDWPDVLLEYESSPGRPGWIRKDLPIDFLLIGFLPTRRGLLLPWLHLRAAFERHGRNWYVSARDGTDGFRLVYAVNPGYVTRSIAVPTAVLLDAVRDACQVAA